MQEPKDYDLIDKDYTELIGLQKALAEKQKPLFVSLNAKVIKIAVEETSWEKHPEYVIIVLVFEYYKKAVLFQDNDILDKISELKLPKSLKRWFVSIDDIHREYGLIINNGIKIERFAAFQYIKLYLIGKYRYDMQMKYLSGIHDNTAIPQLTKDLIALKKSRKYSGANPKRPKNAYEIYLNEAINQFEKEPIEKIGPKTKTNLDFMINMSKGKSEFFLKKVLDECFEYDIQSLDKTSFYSAIYGLFALLMQDRNFITEEEFDNNSKYRISTYKSFNSYKHHTIDRIFNSKNK